MKLLIEKSARRLLVLDGDRIVLRCRVALGSCPEGPKRRAGDGRTPEGRYTLCLVKEQGKWGRSLGLSYPSREDAALALWEGRIDGDTFRAVEEAHRQGRRPPWGTSLGGEIYLHEGGTASDWTAGCIALEKEDMDRLFPLREQIEEVEIVP